jgi:2-hydroxychromene-2-carboxylate isomerase
VALVKRDPILFYFDLASPYAYFASLRIDALAARHGRKVDWRAFMVGAAFQTTGAKPLVHQGPKGDYSRHDWERTARRMRLKFALPAGFPTALLPPSRIFWWIKAQDSVKAAAYAKAVMNAYFGGQEDMTSIDIAAGHVIPLGLSREQAAAAAQDAAWKQHLKMETDAAIALGAFGSPFLFVDGEPFWGNDKLDEIENWLARGGW